MIAHRIPAMLRAAAAMAAALVVLWLVLAGGAPGNAANREVATGDNWFCDSGYQDGVCPVTVNAGETVTWSYPGSGTSVHTITDCGVSCAPPSASPSFDSGLIYPGGGYSRTFDQPGTVNYYCLLHPDNMRGIITVVQGPPASTSTSTNTPAPTPPPTPGPTAPPVQTTPQNPATTPPADTPVPSRTTTRSPIRTPVPSTSGVGGSGEGDEGEDGASLQMLAIGGLALTGTAVVAATIWRRRGRQNRIH